MICKIYNLIAACVQEMEFIEMKGQAVKTKRETQAKWVSHLSQQVTE